MDYLWNYKATGKITPELILEAKAGRYSHEEKISILADLERIHRAVEWFETHVWFEGNLRSFATYADGPQSMEAGETRCIFVVIEDYIQIQFSRFTSFIDIYTRCQETGSGTMGTLKIVSSADNAICMIHEIGQAILTVGQKFHQEHN